MGADDLEAYAAYLVSHHEEADRLVEALAINFSFFYRDRGLFRILGEQVLGLGQRGAEVGILEVIEVGSELVQQLPHVSELAVVQHQHRGSLHG